MHHSRLLGDKATSAPILRGVYDGIIIQGNIQHFDSDIQSKMQYLYKCLDEKKKSNPFQNYLLKF